MITVDVFMDEWQEQAHPRAKSGKQGGQFVKRGTGGSAGTSGGRERNPAVIPYATYKHPPILEYSKQIHQAATSSMSVHEKAHKIHDLAQGYVHPSVTAYANRVLRLLETIHGVEAHSLGKAAAKGNKPIPPKLTPPIPPKGPPPKPAVPPKPPKPPAPPPVPPEPPKPPPEPPKVVPRGGHPELPANATIWMKIFHRQMVSADVPVRQKMFQAQMAIDDNDLPMENKAYAEEWLDHLKTIKPPAQPALPPDASISIRSLHKQFTHPGIPLAVKKMAASSFIKNASDPAKKEWAQGWLDYLNSLPPDAVVKPATPPAEALKPPASVQVVKIKSGAVPPAPSIPPSKRASKEDALSAKTIPAERDYHASAWNEKWFPGIWNMVHNVKLGSVTHESKDTAFYNRLGKRIDMGQHDTTSFNSLVTWRHEFGHAIDNYLGGKTPADQGGHPLNYASYLRGRLALAKDSRALTKSANSASSIVHQETVRNLPEHDLVSAAEKVGFTDPEEFKSYAQNQMQAAPNLLASVINGHVLPSGQNRIGSGHEATMFNDFLGAITTNKIGWGHSNAYYAQDKARTTGEAFANYFALSCGPYGKVWRGVLHSVAPNLSKVFDGMLSDAMKETTDE